MRVSPQSLYNSISMARSWPASSASATGVVSRNSSSDREWVTTRTWVLVSRLEDRLDRRRQVAAVVGEYGSAGAHLRVPRGCPRVDPEAVVEPPAAQSFSHRGQFGKRVRVGIFGQDAVIGRQGPGQLV